MSSRILLLPGDGIGPEVVREATVLEAVDDQFFWDSVSEKDDWAALRLTRRARLILMPLVPWRGMQTRFCLALSVARRDASQPRSAQSEGCWRFALT